MYIAFAATISKKLVCCKLCFGPSLLREQEGYFYPDFLTWEKNEIDRYRHAFPIGFRVRISFKFMWETTNMKFLRDKECTDFYLFRLSKWYHLWTDCSNWRILICIWLHTEYWLLDMMKACWSLFHLNRWHRYLICNDNKSIKELLANFCI